MSSPGQFAEEFQSRYSGDPAVYRAPGRVNIIGGHSDYNDGFVLPTTTALYTWIAIAPRSDRSIRAYSSNFDEEVDFELDDIRRSTTNHWSDYVKGVAQVLSHDARIKSGFDILIHGDLPLGGGLSSSASLETGLAFAMLDIQGQEIDRRDLALLCQRAEVEFVGARCGVMDQYAISCGASGQATLIDCRALTHELIPLPGDLNILVVDTGVKHQLAAGGLNTRREECEAAVSALSVNLPHLHALRDLSLTELEDNKALLNDTQFRRSRHVVSEIARVEKAAHALRSGDVAAVGELISASHASLRDDYEVSCPELESLIDIISSCDGVHGARLVGAGFGGCAICIVEPDNLRSVMDTVSENYGTMLGRAPWMHEIAASGPVEKAHLTETKHKETAA